MPEDQAGRPPIRTIRPIRTIQPIHTVRIIQVRSSELRPPIKTILKSTGGAFWTALSEETRADIEGGLANSERWLADHFPQEHSSPLIRKTRELALLRQPEIQNDPDTCSIVATANAFRVLDGPSPAYTQKGIQDRIEELHGARWITLWPASLKELVESGEPYDRFEVSQIPRDPDADNGQPKDVLKLLQEFDSGSVATQDWKISPSFVDRTGITTHARTMAGFSISQGKLFFHIIDPFKGRVEPWSFRDLLAATGEPYGLSRDRLVDIMNHRARNTIIISKS